MAAKVVKKYSVSAKGILNVNVENKTITLEIEGVDEPVNLADLLCDMNGMDVSISIGQSVDVV